MTAGTRYSFSIQLALVQYLRNQTVVVIFANSSAEPIMIMGITAPAKMAARPIIEYQAAIELSANATNSVALLNVKIFENI
jgi:hypothetical protein